MTDGFGNRFEMGWRKLTIRIRNGYPTMKHGKAMPESEPNCSPGSEKAMHDDYTRCGTPLVYGGQLQLRPDILAELGEQQQDQEASRST